MNDTVIPFEKLQCFDNCPICKALMKAYEEDRELTEDEMEIAVVEAEVEEILFQEQQKNQKEKEYDKYN